MFFAALLPALLSAGTSLIGAGISSSANNKAAAQKAAAQEAASQIQMAAVGRYIEALQQGLSMQEAAVRSGYEAEIAAINSGTSQQLAAIREGAAGAESVYEGMRVDTAPGMAMLRQIVADPMSLTPEQRYELDRTREVVGGNIRASGFGGSGRTAAALMRDVEGGVRNNMLSSNRAAAMNVAQQMGSDYTAAGGQIAALKQKLGVGEAEIARDASVRTADAHTGYGTKIANIYGDHQSKLGDAYLSLGRTEAEGKTAAADTRANATTANAQLWGSAIGDIGSAIASANRESRYADRMRSLGY